QRIPGACIASGDENASVVQKNRDVGAPCLRHRRGWRPFFGDRIVNLTGGSSFLSPEIVRTTSYENSAIGKKSCTVALSGLVKTGSLQPLCARWLCLYQGHIQKQCKKRNRKFPKFHDGLLN